jgi:hypothetical protein
MTGRFLIEWRIGICHGGHAIGREQVMAIAVAEPLPEAQCTGACAATIDRATLVRSGDLRETCAEDEQHCKRTLSVSLEMHSGPAFAMGTCAMRHAAVKRLGECRSRSRKDVPTPLAAAPDSSK